MPMTLAAHEQPIFRVFSNDYVFRIPPYQRPYAWTTDQAGELFGDLTDFMSGQAGGVEELPPYFLGSVVLIKADNAPEADVVDGQQRLTTLTLLLSAIRANVQPSNGSDITQLIYERGSQILSTQDRFRLSLRDRDREFFQKYVQREGGFAELVGLENLANDSQRYIRDNARLFDKRLKALPEPERLKIAQFVVTRCYLVIVATPDLNSAYRIFSVLNTRGLDLSATDLLKAQIIGALPANARDVYTKKWEDSEEDLGRTAFGDLFAHIRMVYRKAKPKGTLLEEFKESVLRGMQPQHFVDDVLLPMAQVFEQLIDQTYESVERAERVNEHLKWLMRLDFSDWLPPALAFAIRYRNKAEMMEQFFRDLERLAYALLVTRAGINERIERFSRLTEAVELKADLEDPTAVLQLNAQEQWDMYSALSGPIYETLSARSCATVLLRLDSLLSGGGATYQYDTVTVEHVLPQTPAPDTDWIGWFPDIIFRELTVHKLGNLVLLTRRKNSAASNYDFSRKKIAYFTKGGISPFALTTQVLQNSAWTPEIVAARQAELLAILEMHWRLEARVARLHNVGTDVAIDGESLWRVDVLAALRELGGQASLPDIYRVVEARRSAGGRSVPKSIDAIVRRTLEENSTDSLSYKGKNDLFRIDNKGAGVWRLR
jgi:Protein of unknown function DUF262/Protein of unknown function (DUF1524)